METRKCRLQECKTKISGGENLPLFCPEHNDYNINKRKCIDLYKYHLWIYKNGEKQYCERCKVRRKIYY